MRHDIYMLHHQEGVLILTQRTAVVNCLCTVLRVSEGVALACRLQRAELELLAGMFEEFWDGQDNDLAAYGLAAPMLHQQAPNQAPSASPNSTPAASSTGAGKRLSTAKANGVATASGRGAAEACQPSQQRNNGGVADVAADILKGASSEARDCQGGCTFAQYSDTMTSAALSANAASEYYRLACVDPSWQHHHDTLWHVLQVRVSQHRVRKRLHSLRAA